MFQDRKTLRQREPLLSWLPDIFSQDAQIKLRHLTTASVNTRIVNAGVLSLSEYQIQHRLKNQADRKLTTSILQATLGHLALLLIFLLPSWQDTKPFRPDHLHEPFEVVAINQDPLATRTREKKNPNATPGEREPVVKSVESEATPPEQSQAEAQPMPAQPSQPVKAEPQNIRTNGLAEALDADTETPSTAPRIDSATRVPETPQLPSKQKLYRGTVMTSRQPPATFAQIDRARKATMEGVRKRIANSDGSNSYGKRSRTVTQGESDIRYSSYLEAFYAKVQSVADRNTSNELDKIYGRLYMTVMVKLARDGRIISIRMLNSSGNQILDQKAISIIRMSAPFAPFPPDIAAQNDILDIQSRWVFLPSGRFFRDR